MTRTKIDGIVEAVHYGKNGQVDWARVYLRRGPTWSDRILLDRQALVRELSTGKRFYAGRRIPLLAGTFETTLPVNVIRKDGRAILVTGQQPAERDRLEGVPEI